MIAITGASGQLGKLVVQQLLEKTAADQLAVVVRSPEKVAEFAAAGVAVRQADYEDTQGMVEAFRGVDVLLLISSNGAPDERIRQHRNAVDAAVKAGVGRLVYTSIAYLTPDDPYIGTVHLDTEAYLRQSGLDYTLLRPNLYVDSVLGSVKDAIQSGVLTAATGSGKSAYLSREDIARGAVAVLLGQGHSGKTYILSGPQALGAGELAAIASRQRGKEVKVNLISFEEQEQQLLAGGVPQAYIGLLVGISKMIASGGLSEVSSDLETLTGTPATALEAML